ncbi:MAG: ABC transporter ATP-binding protein/permease [Clostridium luticellarii]|jgi:ATP-binding cassette subfamily B protein|nr:ABC transporter ATP-binding protein [Clostridium luticellarii]MCI1944022.1 ABC transporter ATP-binding protein/permease [Clostridium luticellarii]MCI1967336.1 ABC transporter ATP-binding protein/permease [Clostridium luticellarii]MCI1995527.1 ABC transporter ATP-binding protein/permease [Clostridium luticellarii]MCI2039178.1 ABC transporter ATP-binding protein/permease [Clostridium luticellarii]
MKKYVDKYWKGFFLAILCLTVEALCDLMQPTIMSKIVDVGVADKNMDYIVKNGLLMLGITALGAVGASGRNILSGMVSQNFSADLRQDLFKEVQNFSFQSIDKFERSSLITRLTNDVTQVQNFVNSLMRIAVKAPIICLGSIIMAARLNLRLSIIIFAVISLVALLIFLNMKMGYPYFIKVQRALDKVNSVMREYLSGVRVVKAFNRSDYENERFKNFNEDLGRLSIKSMRFMSIFSPGINLVINIGIVFVLWIGGLYVNSGTMQVGQIIAFTNYMTQILFSIMIISAVFNTFVRFRASAGRIFEIFEDENEGSSNGLLSDFKVNGKIEFENVSFSYGDGHKAVENVSFVCMPGETIGIVGATGSGKSTLVNLIPRFYDTTSGIIKIDGVDIKNIDEKALRDKIALVPQKTILFTGSVLENIRWGKENASLQEVKEAAGIAQADEFISKFPEKYDTRIGQGGVNFSGGQKQRVSIARAIVRKPSVLILDDCTSAVDASTEVEIRKKLKNYSDKLTCIIIAQKIASVISADKIVVMDNGKLAGMGRHDELIKNCQVYKDIFLSQVGREKE